ncbi:Major facilitator superfamily domain general substrate transporter [Penicillium vulpinum]|uniref:Major facilitator superfamily domain general substrate transporter n=1 Tax=Penicillium vulpinum TaxID=29845 RepID=UPI002546AAFD|nr:Major facilitator superfamily domain general substrate transporter [Penicillium vulpinum]KAJ5953065.1 Major facilitator superfamily domain general substrate transporter [Penicillium vulpinum]
MLIAGFSMLSFLAIYEKWVAPVPLLNIVFLTERTVISACPLNATYRLSYYCWNNYFSSFLQVANGLTITEAGYVSNTFVVVSGVLFLFFGWAICRTDRLKWLLYISTPLHIFTQGLMIYFRKPSICIGYQTMCQIFISIGGSIFIIVEQIEILAAVDHQQGIAAYCISFVKSRGYYRRLSRLYYLHSYLDQYLPQGPQRISPRIGYVKI